MSNHLKTSINEIGYIRKVAFLTSRILDLIDNHNDIDHSDLQGCIDAVIIEAIQYGKDGLK